MAVGRINIMGGSSREGSIADIVVVRLVEHSLAYPAEINLLDHDLLKKGTRPNE